ncbi:hypothetical protein FV228_26725 [Methylobacterium sp. WL18]|nr:hypothetical protein FV228_26725 [Methylobacterium sp. WL18]
MGRAPRHSTASGSPSWPDGARVPSPVRERDRVRDATSPERPDPSPQPSPARERGRVALRMERGVTPVARMERARLSTRRPGSGRSS